MRIFLTLFSKLSRAAKSLISAPGRKASIEDDVIVDPHTVLAPLIARDDWQPVSELQKDYEDEIQSDCWMFDTAPSVELLKRQQSDALNAASESFARLREVVSRVAAAAPVDASTYTPTEPALAAEVHDFLFDAPETADTLDIYGEASELFDAPLAEIDVPLLVAAREYDEYHSKHARTAN